MLRFSAPVLRRVSRVVSPVRLRGPVNDEPSQKSRMTHIDAPPKWRYGRPNDGVLVDCDKLSILENFQRFSRYFLQLGFGQTNIASQGRYSSYVRALMKKKERSLDHMQHSKGDQHTINKGDFINAQAVK